MSKDGKKDGHHGFYHYKSPSDNFRRDRVPWSTGKTTIYGPDGQPIKPLTSSTGFGLGTDPKTKDQNSDFWKKLGKTIAETVIRTFLLSDEALRILQKRAEVTYNEPLSQETIKSLVEEILSEDKENLAREVMDQLIIYQSTNKISLISQQKEGDTSSFTLQHDSKQIITPESGGKELMAYLQSLEELQNILNEARSIPLSPVIIRAIVQNSPVNITLEGASQAVDTVKEIVVPWRRKHAETMAKLQEKQAEEEIAIKQAQILEIHARAKKDRQEATRLAAEAEVKKAEAERIKLENQKLQIEIQRSYIELAVEILSKASPNLSDTDKILYITRLLPVLKSLVNSEVQLISED